MTNARSKFTEKRDEPLFIAISQNDVALKAAYARASATLERFKELLGRDPDAIESAKLRFRDPDESERLGEDRYFFLWLSNVLYRPSDRLFSGTFFEVPREAQKWHQVGESLAFEGEDIFDWMVLTEDGRLHGGYTLRVSRAKLPENERPNYDRYIGVRVWEDDA